MYDYDPSAPCSAFPTTTLHYDQGQIVGYSPGTVAAHDYSPNDQMAWTDAKSWVFANGMTGSYTSGVEDQEVLYGSQDLREAIDLLRRGSSSFDNAMRALENDPNVQLKVMWGYVNDPLNPAWTQLLGLNNRGQMVVVVVIDPGNLDRMASDPYYQARGGANLDEVLAHEIYGHALGKLTTGCDEPCAIMRENAIRQEMGYPQREY